MLELGLDFISAIFIQIGLFYIFGRLYGKKPSIKFLDYCIVLIVGSMQVILNLFELKTLSTLITVIYMFAMYKRIYHCNTITSTNYSIIIWILAMLLDSVVILLVNNSPLAYFYIENEKVVKALGSIFMSIILVALSHIRLFIIILNKLYKKLCKLNITLTQIYLLVAVFLIIGYIGIQQMNKPTIIIFVLSLELSIVGVIVLLIIMKYQIITLKTTNRILEKNNEINLKIITNYRTIKHNLENQLLGVKTVANKEAKNLLDNLIKEYNQSFYVKHDINSIPSGINGLVMEKLYNYKEKNINISIHNEIKNDVLKITGPRNYNLFCEALGVVLDNALEASIKSEEKMIYLNFKETEDTIWFQIINSFSGLLDIDQLGNVKYTSKENGHGLGMYSLIGRNNLTVNSSIKNNLFINNISVKKRISSDK